MLTIKAGGHRVLERDDQTARKVSEMLCDLEREGMDAVRRYSRELDQWDPPSFELSHKKSKQQSFVCDAQLKQDTEFCQNN